MSPTPQLKRSQTFGYFAAFIGLGLVTASLGPTLERLAGNTGSTLDQIAILFTVQALGLMVGDLVAGLWYDRRPAHPFLAGVLVIIGLMLALVPLVSSLWVLAAIMFIMGWSAGCIDVGGNTLLVWVHREEVGPRMNGLHLFFGLGAFLSPIVVTQIVDLSGGLRWAYWALALLMLPPALMLARLDSPARPHREPAGGQLTGGAGRPRRLLVFLIAAMFFLFVGAELAYGGWIFLYARALDLATLTMAGYLTSLFWGALTLGRLLSIPLAARARPRTMLMADIVGLVLSLSLLLLLPGQTWVVWLGTFGMGLSMANVFPTLMVLGERHLSITANITGWFLVGGSLGSMTVPWLIGQRFEVAGPQVTMVILLATILLAAVALAAFLLAVRSPARTASQATETGVAG